MKRLFLTLLYAATIVAAASAANGPQILKKVRARYRTVNSMTASLSEVLCSGATGTCKRFSGTVKMKRPAKLRLEITAPEKQLVVCDGKSLVLYMEKEKQATRYDMAKSNQMISMLNPLDGLLDGEVTGAETDEGVHTLTMSVPKLKDLFKEIKLTVDAKTLLITGISGENAAGDHAEYEFSNIKTHIRLKSSRFTFTPPAGVTVIDQ
jgi:outer membrane lipoprotein carrier protein